MGTSEGGSWCGCGTFQRFFVRFDRFLAFAVVLSLSRVIRKGSKDRKIERKIERKRKCDSNLFLSLAAFDIGGFCTLQLSDLVLETLLRIGFELKVGGGTDVFAVEFDRIDRRRRMTIEKFSIDVILHHKSRRSAVIGISSRTEETSLLAVGLSLGQQNRKTIGKIKKRKEKKVRKENVVTVRN